MAPWSPLLLLALLHAPLQEQPDPRTPAREKAFWASLAQSSELPEGQSAFSLILELSQHLGSRDPELRDTYGYGLPALWIQRQGRLAPAELRQLADLWSANLLHDIGSSGDDSVLLRSFSALNLSLLVAADLTQPFLDPDSFAALLGAALEYLEREEDLRGHEPQLGWVHAVAHTADLLKFLGRNRALDGEGQIALLEGIARRMTAPTGHVFNYGEDDRLARAVMSVLQREDFEPQALELFLGELRSTVTARRGAGNGFDLTLHAAHRNAKNLLSSVHTEHLRIARPNEAQRVQREALRACLLEL